MAQKKDRSRFTIKFRENDPAHERTICILESQGQRNIAPFLVNAVLHYVQCSETPDVSHMLVENQVPIVDRNAIEEIVWGILRQQGILKGEEDNEVKRLFETDNTSEGTSEINMTEDIAKNGVFPQKIVNTEMRAIITRTLSAFRTE